MFFKEYIFSIRKFFLAAFLIFSFSAVLGYFYAQNFPSETAILLEDLMRQFEPIIEMSFLEQFLVIFLNNSFIAFLSVILGLIFAIFPFLVLLSNGFLLGVMLSFVHSVAGWQTFLALILPHGIIEIPAVLLAGAAGLKIGKTVMNRIFKKEGDVKEELNCALIFFLKILFPLLAIAALIETLFISQLL